MSNNTDIFHFKQQEQGRRQTRLFEPPTLPSMLKRWRMLLFTLLYIAGMGSSFSLYATSAPVGVNINAKAPVVQGFGDFFDLCERHQQICMEILGCDDLEDCRRIIECFEDEECDSFPDCDRDEECEEEPECSRNNDEEECEEFPECDADEEECEEFPECDADEEECEEFPECDADEEECEELPECDADEEECEEFPECDADEEECEALPECDDEDTDCDDGSDEGDNEGQEQTSGFVNPNPAADKTVMLVDTEAANAASRFLSQATLGADYALITQVASFGEDVWLESQFNEPVGYLAPYTQFLVQKALTMDEQGRGEQLIFETLGDIEKFHQNAWWTQVMTSPDLVRQRVAMALSEIFVVSNNVEALGTVPYSMSAYYDTLLTHSFGNFRDLLLAISLNPAMGEYLSHKGNRKANPATGTFPDENYAREVMQLFSIGLFELNQDGSRKQDANGNDIPTYGQAEIREFAKIFTGLNFDSSEAFDSGEDPGEHEDNFLKPMRMYDEFHSTGEKRLLRGQVVPAGQTGMQDLNNAIDNLFNHPNVGPFIGKQLIQRLVTSNPSPAYVSRVSAAFNGNTGAPRGDMKAVIRAILLDPEARPDLTRTDLNGNHGRLREPFLRLVRLKRMFDTSTSDNTFNGTGLDVVAQIKQFVMYSPSVFNFFQPGYSPNGELRDNSLLAPEFQIVNASTIMEIKNLVDLWLETGRFEEQSGLLPMETVNFAAEMQLAANPDALLDHLDTVMTYGTLTTSTRDAVKAVLDNEPEMIERVKKAIYLIAISPDYAVAL